MTMAKNSRFPGGYYNSAVMNGGESEGSGSSGRVDMEIMASEDSIPVRKCISLNSNQHDMFGVPTQVLPVSGISPSQRKDLVLRLRAELEQIRIIQKKVELRRTNCVTLSSSSGIHSCSNRQNGNRIENFRKSSMMTSGPGKILNQESHKGRGWNRGTSGRFETAREAPVPSSACLILIRQCEALLKRLMSHQFGWAFNNPVDVVKLNLPDYLTVIKHPMDLGTIKSKIASGVYLSPLEFLADVRLTFSNSMTYNPPGNDFHFMADSMSKFFEARWKSIEKKIPVSDAQIVPETSGLREGVETAKRIPPSKRRKITPLQRPVIPEPIVERIMTDEEKHNLGRELESLLAEMPAHIVDFLREHSSNGRETGEDEIEIDIDEFSDDTLFALRKLLDDFVQEKQKNHARAEPCEIELLNESGLSNSSMQPCKGNDPIDEDVDIGGNEPPVSSYPPVEIEKDSDSSSDSEADGAKASTPVTVTKVLNPVETEAQSDGKISVGDQIEGNQSVSGLDQVEVQFQQMPNSVESDYCQDGDSAPTERQVSPEKLYRAALLKNRFADTILKAREKTLKQGEKGDPEKLRREKEQREIQQRKEKAKLQAEAKAAEDARRRAEVEAAAEAKRKRELEREAARQALLKIEKTVEINENSRFLEDLEMLRAAPVEPLPISVDETSPDHSQDGLGGFKFGGSNPLEQLGLYMKEDEEEEEGEPHSLPHPLEQLGLYMRKDNVEEECEPPSIPKPLEQLGLYMKNDEDEEEGELPSLPNPLEQLGLYMKKDDDEEEDGDPPSLPNPLEQLGLYMKKDDDEEEDGDPPSVPNPLEQLGLYMKRDDKEPPSVPNPLEQLGLYMKKDEEEEEREPPGVPNPLEQLGLYMKKDDEEEEGEPLGVPNPLEQLGLYMKKDEEEGELPNVSNPLEQHGLYKKNDDDEEGELPSVSNPLEQDVLDMKKDDDDEGGEPSCVPNPPDQLELSMKKVDVEEGEPTNVPNLTNDVEEGEID